VPDAHRPLLRDLAPVYVTHRAAQQYGAAEGVDEERARRELTALLPLARRAPGDEDPPAYRYRSKHTGLDLTARVELETPLDDAPDARIAVVVSVSVRETRT